MGIFDKFKGMFGNHDQEARPDIPDDVTTDPVLRSYRRQRRVQLEELEKRRLKEAIEAHQKWRTRRGVFGMIKHGDEDADYVLYQRELIRKKIEAEKKRQERINRPQQWI